jgi:Ca-activated chloride channel family protein
MKAILSLLIISIFCISQLAFKHSNTGYTKQIPTIDTFPFISTIKEFKGKLVTSEQGTVTLTSALHNDFYHLDSTNKLGYFYVEARVGAFYNAKSARLPLNIAIVIDRSGSMAGSKMKFAKEAAKAIIDKLNAEDVVSVIMYDHEVTLLQPSVKVLLKDSIKHRIDAIEERGSTNLWGGSEKGYEQVKTGFKPGYVNRVLLISDGLANSGLTNARIINNKVRQYKDEEGITLSSFGVGLDYNEVLMTDMAENGGGNYYFINDPEKMAAILEQEIIGLAKIAAKNAELQIDLPQGIQVTKIYAYKADVKANRITIKFRDLFSEDVKGVLLQFKLPHQINTSLYFTTSLNYTDVNNGLVKQLQQENTLQPIQNEGELLTHYNKKVLEQTLLYQSNETLEKAMLEADKELYEGARLTLKKNKEHLDLHTLLVKSSVELQKMDSINQAYLQQLLHGEKMDRDSFKLMQKTNRAGSYKLRTKRL